MVNNTLFPPLQHGWTDFDPERKAQGPRQGSPQNQPLQGLPPAQDSFRHVPPPEQAKTGLSAQGDGLKISYQFDLFYELSQKVSAKMGRQGQERFFELSETVTEKFQGSFSLSIDPVGSFLNGTDKSLDLDPSVTSEFFDAVEGLAKLTPEALQDFLRETDDLFSAIEGTYGEAGGAFDDIKAQIQAQAQQFFDQVADIRGSGGEDALALPEGLPEEIAAGLPPVQGETAGPNEETGESPLVPTNRPADPYQDFLREFLDYARKYRASMALEVMSFQQTTIRSYAAGKLNPGKAGGAFETEI